MSVARQGGIWVLLCYLVDFLRTIQAGTEGQLAHLLRALPSRGFRVELISIQESPYLATAARSDFPEITFHVLNGSSDLSRSLTAFPRLFQRLRVMKPDLVHAIFPAANTLGALVSRLAGIQTIIGSRRDMGYAYGTMDLALLRLAGQFVSRIIVNANKIKERTTEREGIPPGKIAVVHNGLVFNTSRSTEHEKKGKIVAIVANLNREVKRVDVFLKAAALVAANQPQTIFWVVGDGHLRPILEGLAMDLGIHDRVEFLGRRTDILSLLPQVEAGVLSSDSEGLSNAIMEYMACGLPVVATAVGGNSELVENGANGFLVPPGNPGSMAAAILRLLQDPELAVSMGRRGRERIMLEFGIERMVAETLDVYRAALAERGTRLGGNGHGQ